MNTDNVEVHKNCTPLNWNVSIVKNFCEVPLGVSSKYLSIEIQKTEMRGISGHVAVLHVQPGVIDILFESHLELDRDWTRSEPSTAHLKVRNLKPIQFYNTHCRVSASEVDVKARFSDYDGEEIEFEIRHRKANKVKPIFTPTPPQVNPSCLRFLVMNDFCLLPRSSYIRITIGAQPQQIKYFILPKYLALYTGARAGSDFLLTALDFNMNIQSPCSSGVSEHDGFFVENAHAWFRLVGHPTMTEILNTNAGQSKFGEVQVKSSVGVVATGKFRIERVSNDYYYSIENIKQDWVPAKTSVTRQIMRLFRNRNRRHENWKCEAVYTVNNGKLEVKNYKWSN